MPAAATMPVLSAAAAPLSLHRQWSRLQLARRAVAAERVRCDGVTCVWRRCVWSQCISAILTKQSMCRQIGGSFSACRQQAGLPALQQQRLCAAPARPDQHRHGYCRRLAAATHWGGAHNKAAFDTSFRSSENVVIVDYLRGESTVWLRYSCCSIPSIECVEGCSGGARYPSC